MCKALEDLKKEAEEYGRMQGEDIVCTLMKKVLDSGNEHLIGEILSDATFRRQMMKEYGLL